jgi:hypothetical protein
MDATIEARGHVKIVDKKLNKTYRGLVAVQGRTHVVHRKFPQAGKAEDYARQVCLRYARLRTAHKAFLGRKAVYVLSHEQVIEGITAQKHLYRIEPAITVHDRETEYVIVFQLCKDGEIETAILPAREGGEAAPLDEIKHFSRKWPVTHAEAMHYAGYSEVIAEQVPA